MKVTDATALIKAGLPAVNGTSTWADLGCGSGIFTNALASLLGQSSKIYAVDKDDQALRILDTPNVKIEFLKRDFMTDTFPFPNLDGIMMANSLHYVKDKPAFIEKLKKHLKRTGQLLIVEYDTESQNRWVPYPISFGRLRETFKVAGFNSIQKVGERNSVYRSEKIYASSIKYS